MTSWGGAQRDKLLEYLMQRRGTKFLALSFLRSLAEQALPLSEMNALFSLLQRVNYGAMVAEQQREAALDRALDAGATPEEQVWAVVSGDAGWVSCRVRG